VKVDHFICDGWVHTLVHILLLVFDNSEVVVALSLFSFSYLGSWDGQGCLEYHSIGTCRQVGVHHHEEVCNLLWDMAGSLIAPPVHWDLQDLTMEVLLIAEPRALWMNIVGVQDGVWLRCGSCMVRAWLACGEVNMWLTCGQCALHME